MASRTISLEAEDSGMNMSAFGEECKKISDLFKEADAKKKGDGIL